MRRILVDHVRRNRDRRGGKAIHLGLTDARTTPAQEPVDAIDALALDRALVKLSELDPDQVRMSNCVSSRG